MQVMNLPQRPDPSINTPTARGRESSIKIWIALFGAPFAWIAQVSLSEPLAAHACYPFLAPLSEPIWEALPAILAAISLTCLAAALLSGYIVWTLWRRPEHHAAADKSVIGGNEELKRFLVNLSTMSSFIFLVAIIFNICAIWLVPPCSSWF